MKNRVNYQCRIYLTNMPVLSYINQLATSRHLQESHFSRLSHLQKHKMLFEWLRTWKTLWCVFPGKLLVTLCPLFSSRTPFLTLDLSSFQALWTTSISFSGILHNWHPINTIPPFSSISQRPETWNLTVIRICSFVLYRVLLFYGANESYRVWVIRKRRAPQFALWRCAGTWIGDIP